jgi:hypothetical protein
MLRFFEIWNLSWYHGWYQYATACAFYALVALHIYTRSKLFDAVKVIAVDTAKDFAAGKGYEFVVDLVFGAFFMALITCLVLFSAYFWPISVSYMSSIAFGRWRQKHAAQ